MKRVSSGDLDEKGHYLRLCVFGEPGSGKTWFGASAALDPLTAPVLFVDYRSQIVALRSNPSYLEAIEDERLVIVTPGNYGELSHIYTFLLAKQHPSFDQFFTKYGPPKTLVVDSITELQRSEVMRVAGNKPDRFLSSVEVPSPRDWGSILNQFTLLAHLFYNLEMHVIFSGLEGVDFGKHDIGEAPPIVGYRLALQGQSQRQFPAYALTLMRLDRVVNVPNTFNVGYTQASRARTKEQTGFLPAQIGNPTIPKLARWIRERGVSKDDKQVT